MPRACHALIAAMLAISSPALAAPAIWEVRDADSAIWFFGSFHVLPPATDWRTEFFDSLLAAADTIVFEADVSPAMQAEIGAKGFARGIYVDGTLLTDVLEPQAEAQLRAAAASIDMPVGPVLAMRPWLAANTIMVAALTSAGFSDPGVEYSLQPELATERLRFLETGDEQLEVLAGAPEDEQIALLTATLAELHTLPKIMDKLTNHWLAGTPEQLADLFIMEMGGFEDAFLDRLLYARNRNWISPIETMLADNQAAFIIVGAAHLVGDGSVLDLLEEAGYRSERVQ